MRVGAILMAFALSIAARSYSIPVFVGFLLLHAVGYSIVTPSLQSLISRNAKEGAQGATMGVYQSAGSLARIIGPLMAGVLFDHFGIQVPFYAASFLFVTAFLVITIKGKVWRVLGVDRSGGSEGSLSREATAEA